MPPSPTTPQAHVFLTEAAPLRALNRQVQLLLNLQRVWQGIAPASLAAVSRMGQSEAGEIVLYCDHGAAAAKLRQLLPTLAAALRDKGIPSSCMQVKVRARAQPVAPRAVPKREISHAGLETLAQLRDEIEAGSLQAALDHLLAQHTARRP
jgi:hypothetical protein